MAKEGAAEPSLLELWEKGELCDVQIEASDGVIVPAHRIVLASRSEYFRALFVGSGRSMAERYASTLDLPEIDGPTLKLLLKVVYSGNDSVAAYITEATVSPLLQAASYLCIPMIQRACSEYLLQNFSLESAVDLLLLADRYGCDGLRRDVKRYLEGNFVEFLSSGAAHTLQELPLSLLEEILRSDSLALTNEGDLLVAGAIWALPDTDNRMQPVLHVLADAMRADLSMQEYWESFEQAIKRFPRFCSAELRRKLKAAALDFAHLIENKRMEKPCKANPRNPVRMSIMAVGGVDEHWRGLPTTEIYDCRLDSWSVGPKLPTPFHFPSASQSPSYTYLLESSTFRTTFLCYDRLDNSFRRLMEPQSPRMNMATAVLPGYTDSSSIYVLGGRTGRSGGSGNVLTSVALYNTWSRFCWQPDPAPMTVARASLAAVTLDGKLYAIGGQNDRSTNDSVETYDPGVDRWTLCDWTLQQPKKYLAAGVLGGQIVALGGMTASRQRLATVEAWDPREGIRRELPNLPLARSSSGVAVVGDELFVVGGHVGCSGEVYDGVDCFSIRAGKWRKCAPLGGARAGLATVAV